MIDNKGDYLPIHFLTIDEHNINEEQLMNAWMDCHVTLDGVLVAKQTQTQFSQVCRRGPGGRQAGRQFCYLIHFLIHFLIQINLAV